MFKSYVINFIVPKDGWKCNYCAFTSTNKYLVDLHEMSCKYQKKGIKDV